MSFSTQLADEISARIKNLRGKLVANAELAPFTWFRVGGPAEVLFSPVDEEDLKLFIKNLPKQVDVTVLGLGSNLIIRDGGLPGVAIRLGGKAFGDILDEGGQRLRVGTACPDMRLAKFAAQAGIDGLAFFRGIPGAIGGALAMNAGAHGGETRDVLVSARGLDRDGAAVEFSVDDLHMSYRHSELPDGVIFTSALFQGRAGDPEAITAEMERITQAREKAQPIREKTGGSTFKNPPGQKAWELIDAAGCRGLVVGDAQVSELHCNFLINRGRATAGDIEGLGEEVRRRVFENSGVELQWEIKRIGVEL